MLGMTPAQTTAILIVAIIVAGLTICSVVSSIWGSPLEHSSESNHEEEPDGIHRP